MNQEKSACQADTGSDDRNRIMVEQTVSQSCPDQQTDWWDQIGQEGRFGQGAFLHVQFDALSYLHGIHQGNADNSLFTVAMATATRGTGRAMGLRLD